METPQVGVLNQPDLPSPTNIDQGGVGESFQAAGQAIAEVIGERRLAEATEGLTAELDNETNQWWDETHNTEQAPNVVDVFNVDEERFNAAPEPVKALMSEIARQRAAAEQGAISGTELKVRHEAKLREYLNRYPQFTAELQAASGQALGYNPLGAHIDAMMETLQGKESKEAAQWAELDRYADAVGVDMTLKTLDPVEYYSQMIGFARRDTEYEYLARELNITKAVKETRNIAEMDAFQKTAGGRIMGRAQGLVNQIANTVRATDIGGKGAFGVDTLHHIRQQVAAFNTGTRIEIQRDFPEMTQTQIDAFMKPLESNFDLILKSTDLSEMNTALGLFQAQAKAQVYADHPETVNLEIAANILKDLPKIPGLIEKSNLTGALTGLIHNLVSGGTAPIYGASGLGIEPSTMAPKDRGETYNFMMDGMHNVLPLAEKNPKYYTVLKRMALENFKFLDKEAVLGTGGDAKANKKFMSFWSNEAAAGIMSSGERVPGEEMLIDKGVLFAGLMIKREGAKDIQKFDALRNSNIPGNLLDMTPGGGATRPATIADILEMSMQNGEVRFTVNWSNIGFSDESRVPKATKDKVNKMVSQAQMTFGARTTEAVRMIAHINGTKNYDAVLQRYEDDLKPNVIEALMMPNG